MSKSILEMTWDEISEIKDHPLGRYRGVVLGYKVDRNKNDKEYVYLEYKAIEPLDGQDITGVEMNRKLRGEMMYWTDKTRDRVGDRLRKIGPAPESPHIKDHLEQLIGVEVVFTLKAETREYNGKTQTYVNACDVRAA